ncbi:MAG: ATP-binding protein [Angelakisella sp.]
MNSDEGILYHYVVPGDDFTRAGEASGSIKGVLKKLGVRPEVVRKVAISMYEGEINMVIHAGGGEIDVEIDPTYVEMKLIDHGPGIADIDKAMEEGFSTATAQVRNLGFGAGMGLPNMKKYSDTMAIQSVVGTGTTVTMRVNL